MQQIAAGECQHGKTKNHPMRSNLAFVLLLLMAVSCKKSNRNCPSASSTYTFETNSFVDTFTNALAGPSGVFFATIKAGTYTTFRYDFSHAECPEVADGFYSKSLFFMVDPALSSFTYYSDNFQAIRCYYREMCEGCMDGSMVPVAGTIEGQKLNGNEWQVNINVKINDYRSVKVSGKFIKNK